eukprot:FR743541.1.p1 GENE.FR743541.1~~FR743541.1.p1  ORF type:complete len:119 (+),score=20.54 FR743541.1:44-358(+)
MVANQHNQDMRGVMQEYSLEERSILANLERYTIEMDEKMAMAASIRTVTIEKEIGEKEVAVTEAKGNIEVAVYTGHMNKNELITCATIETDRMVQNAQHICKKT